MKLKEAEEEPRTPRPLSNNSTLSIYLKNGEAELRKAIELEQELKTPMATTHRKSIISVYPTVEDAVKEMIEEKKLSKEETAARPDSGCFTEVPKPAHTRSVSDASVYSIVREESRINQYEEKKEDKIEERKTEKEVEVQVTPRRRHSDASIYSIMVIEEVDKVKEVVKEEVAPVEAPKQEVSDTCHRKAEEAFGLVKACNPSPKVKSDVKKVSRKDEESPEQSPAQERPQSIAASSTHSSLNSYQFPESSPFARKIEDSDACSVYSDASGWETLGDSNSRRGSVVDVSTSRNRDTYDFNAAAAPAQRDTDVTSVYSTDGEFEGKSKRTHTVMVQDRRSLMYWLNDASEKGLFSPETAAEEKPPIDLSTLTMSWIGGPPPLPTNSQEAIDRAQQGRSLRREPTRRNTRRKPKGPIPLHEVQSLTEKLRAAVLREDALDVARSIDLGADINGPDSEGKTPLHLAVEKGNAKIARVIVLSKNADSEKTDDNGRTALHYAALMGELEVTEVLLQLGANLEAKVEGRTALALAIEQDHIGLARLLIEHGANVNYSFPFKTDVDDNMTVLDFAVQLGSMSAVRLLLDAKASIAVLKGQRASCVHYAAAYGRVDILRILLAAGADVNSVSMDTMLESPLHRAIRLSQNMAVQDLLLSGANMEIPAQEDLTPLQYSVKYSNFRAMNLLLRAGANPNNVDENGKTALHICAELCVDVAIVRLLVEYDADASLQDHSGKLPFQYTGGKLREELMRAAQKRTQQYLREMMGSGIKMPMTPNITHFDSGIKSPVFVPTTMDTSAPQSRARSSSIGTPWDANNGGTRTPSEVSAEQFQAVYSPSIQAPSNYYVESASTNKRNTFWPTSMVPEAQSACATPVSPAFYDKALPRTPLEDTEQHLRVPEEGGAAKKGKRWGLARKLKIGTGRKGAKGQCYSPGPATVGF